jgi:hypothetical protein
VDTSLADGKTTKVREQRSFPSGVMNTFTARRTISEPGKKNSSMKHRERRYILDIKYYILK